MEMHSLLKRQLKKFSRENAVISQEWQNLIDAVNNAYLEFDADRRMLERALELSSQELLQANTEMRAVIQSFPDVFLWLDTSGTILSFKGSSTFEISPWSQNLVGSRIQDIGVKNIAFKKAIEQVEEGKPLVNVEFILDSGPTKHYYEARFLKLALNQIFVIIRDITERKHSEKKLRYLSMHDALTGLYNRAYFEEEMNRLAAPRYQPVGLIICDVDGLKIINDTFGHESGDVLLIETAGILKESMRRGDMVARIGGDEFAILIAKTDQKALDNACKRIRDNIGEYNSGGPKHPLSISIGASIWKGENANMEGLFQEADNNMYRDKLSHRQSYGKSSLFQILNRALEARDFISEGRESNVERLMVELGLKLGFNYDRISELRLLAQFHEVSGMGLNEAILHQDYHFNSREIKQKKGYYDFGERIAESASILLKIGNWLSNYHEYWDGSNYPPGLKAEEIPIECHVLAIADAYDEMIAGTDMMQSEALKKLQRDAGTRFAPEIVDKFIEIIVK